MVLGTSDQSKAIPGMFYGFGIPVHLFIFFPAPFLSENLWVLTLASSSEVGAVPLLIYLKRHSYLVNWWHVNFDSQGSNKKDTRWKTDLYHTKLSLDSQVEVQAHLCGRKKSKEMGKETHHWHISYGLSNRNLFTIFIYNSDLFTMLNFKSGKHCAS